jgi:hypothetical protein
MKIVATRLVPLVLPLVLFAVPLRSEMTVKDYQKFTSSNDVVLTGTTKAYVHGLGEGVEWAETSAELLNPDGVRLFCLPSKLSLNEDNFVDLLDQQIKREAAETTRDKLEKSYIGILLVKAFRETFPCQDKSYQKK